MKNIRTNKLTILLIAISLISCIYGYLLGHAKGEVSGYEQGYYDGTDYGYEIGFAEGEYVGYNIGFNKAVSESNSYLKI